MHKSAQTIHHSRRGFTLVELMVAGVITAFVVGAISISLSQLVKSKNGSKERLDAYMRADAALTTLRKDVVSLTRSDDIFDCQFYLIDNTVDDFPRDELLVFNTALRAVRSIDYNGEGIEYETQYRIEDDEFGPVLWKRRDPVHDDYWFGGGRVTPSVEGLLGLSIEAYDGNEWYEQWDSDLQGLPTAVRLTVIASGHRHSEDVFDAKRAVLRTVVPVDRVMVPKEWLLPTQEEEEALDEILDQELAAASAEGENGANGDASGLSDLGVDPATGQPISSNQADILTTSAPGGGGTIEKGGAPGNKGPQPPSTTNRNPTSSSTLDIPPE